MKTMLKSVILQSLALLFAASVTFAQDRAAFRQEELDQMLAPIALYPDSLLSQMLMASTYPLEVVQAARWSRSRPGLKGQDAVQAIEGMDWDPSVKSLAAFPKVLQMMDERLDWTQRLGEAFLTQEPQVMETIQALRHRAAATGTLGSGAEMQVTRQGGDIVIEPTGPQVIYVPYYDPAIVYGTWWWPAYPPVYWGPPPGYYVRPAYAPGIFWGSGIVISAGFFFGHLDWPHRHVQVVHVHHRHPPLLPAGRRGVVNHTPVASSTSPARWQHDAPPAIRREDAPHHAATLGAGGRRHAGQPVTTIRQSAPASRPSAGSGNPAPRLGGGNHRGEGRVRAAGGGGLQRQ